jgi:hypothetical protein
VAKKVLTWVAIAFALFYVLSAPDDAANAVKSAGQRAAQRRRRDSGVLQRPVRVLTALLRL